LRNNKINFTDLKSQFQERRTIAGIVARQNFKIEVAFLRIDKGK
jgi:hypothetical protein